MHYKIKELHRLITTLKNEEGLSDYGVTLLEGYAVGLETVVKNCSIPAVIHWVAITEKMPESGQCVLLYSPKSGVGEGAWISAKGHFEQWRWNAILTNVSHWAELPQPPCV
jgi:hypothetical protein